MGYSYLNIHLYFMNYDYGMDISRLGPILIIFCKLFCYNYKDCLYLSQSLAYANKHELIIGCNY